MKLRLAGAADADAVAHLHAASWQAHYRGSLSDAYLDGPVEEERRQAWSHRFAAPNPAMSVILAEEGGTLLGFVCVLADDDPLSGSLIDNLHVRVDRKAGGIGRTLMREAATRLVETLPGRPVHLYVKEMNLGARAFYQRIGGEAVAQEIHVGADGSQSRVLRILWASPAALLAATANG